MELLPPATPLAIVTGPSFAKEVAMDLPTAVTVAGSDSSFTQIHRKAALHGGRFRAYTSADMIGAELGGAVKNVMAVATGICDGMKLGDNARAALITRGLAEMMRLGAALNAKPETLMGLAGAGDLILTCTGDLSRNRRLGLLLGKGKTLRQALEEIGQVVEGVNSSPPKFSVWLFSMISTCLFPNRSTVLFTMAGTRKKGWPAYWPGIRKRNTKTKVDIILV